MKYENKRNGKVVELVSQDDRYKTVMLQEVDTGRTFPVTISTFKRWYKKLAEPVVEPVEEAVKLVLKDNDVMVDCSQEPEQVLEQLEADIKSVPKKTKARKKTEMSANIKALHEYVLHTCEELGGTVWVPAKDLKFRGLKVGKHNFVKYNWSNKAVMLFVRAQALGLEAPVTPVNHTFNDKYVFREDTPENRKEIFRIMKTCYDWQLSKNLAKTGETME